MKSFIEISKVSDFSLANLPYGIFSVSGKPPRVGVAIGEFVLDLSVLESEGFLQLPTKERVFHLPFLNSFAKLGRPTWVGVRKRLQNLLSHDESELRDNLKVRSEALIPRHLVSMHLPFEIGGYTDFYSSEMHAANVGKLFRPNDPPLLPNWKHMPIAYNGRASTVVVDGTPIKMPHGQIKLPDQDPIFSECRKLDYEVEVGFFVGKESALGQPIPMSEVEDYLFGLVLVNDWSARDIQAWEYVPLGPFLGKSFATTISPWVVTFEALKEFQIPLEKQIPEPLAYLRGSHANYDIEVKAHLTTASGQKLITTRTNTKYLYWSFAQQLVHHASNGCQMKIGDLLASGTISGPKPEEWGSLLEITFNGKTPLPISDGPPKTFLNVGDEILLQAHAEKSGVRIGFGSASGRIS